jgi:hypothetical protein
VPVAIDALGGAPCRERRGQTGMPVEHRAVRTIGPSPTTGTPEDLGTRTAE